MAPEDLGRVIGRQGRTAAALRTLVALAADVAGDQGAGRVPRGAPVRRGSRTALHRQDERGRRADPGRRGGEAARVARTRGGQPGDRLRRRAVRAGRAVLLIEVEGRLQPLTVSSLRFHQGRPIVGVRRRRVGRGGRAAGAAGAVDSRGGSAGARGRALLPLGPRGLPGRRRPEGHASGASRGWHDEAGAALLVVGTGRDEVLVPLADRDLPGDRPGRPAHRDRSAGGTAGAQRGAHGGGAC